MAQLSDHPKLLRQMGLLPLKERVASLTETSSPVTETFIPLDLLDLRVRNVEPRSKIFHLGLWEGNIHDDSMAAGAGR